MRLRLLSSGYCALLSDNILRRTSISRRTWYYYQFSVLIKELPNPDQRIIMWVEDFVLISFPFHVLHTQFLSASLLGSSVIRLNWIIEGTQFLNKQNHKSQPYPPGADKHPSSITQNTHEMIPLRELHMSQRTRNLLRMSCPEGIIKCVQCRRNYGNLL